VLQLHIRQRGKAALPAWEELHRKEGENGEQKTAFNIIALSLYSILNIFYLYLVCIYLYLVCMFVYLYRDLLRKERRTSE
jgi:hypothetical protein